MLCCKLCRESLARAWSSVEQDDEPFALELLFVSRMLGKFMGDDERRDQSLLHVRDDEFIHDIWGPDDRRETVDVEFAPVLGVEVVAKDVRRSKLRINVEALEALIWFIFLASPTFVAQVSKGYEGTNIPRTYTCAKWNEESKGTPAGLLLGSKY